MKKYTNKFSEWTLGNKLQLGVGAGIGIPALIITALGVFATWKHNRWMKRAEGRN